LRDGFRRRTRRDPAGSCTAPGGCRPTGRYRGGGRAVPRAGDARRCRPRPRSSLDRSLPLLSLARLLREPLSHLLVGPLLPFGAPRVALGRALGGHAILERGEGNVPGPRWRSGAGRCEPGAELLEVRSVLRRDLGGLRQGPGLIGVVVQLPPGLDLAGGRFPLRALRRAVSGGGTEGAGAGLSLQRESPAVRAQPDCEELAALGEVIAPRGGERGILHPSVGGEPTRQPIGRRRQGAIGLDLSPTLLGADRPVQRRLALEDAASLLEV